MLVFILLGYSVDVVDEHLYHLFGELDGRIALENVADCLSDPLLDRLGVCFSISEVIRYRLGKYLDCNAEFEAFDTELGVGHYFHELIDEVIELLRVRISLDEVVCSSGIYLINDHVDYEALDKRCGGNIQLIDLVQNRLRLCFCSVLLVVGFSFGFD